jgi:hypothetical protein
VAPITSTAPTVLAFTDAATPADGLLRITVGIGFRECRKVDVIAQRSRARLGTFDIRFAPSPQPQQLALIAADLKLAIDEGIELVLAEGTAPMWILTGVSSRTPVPPVLHPHLYIPPADADPTAAFLANMKTLAPLQLFGWMEGCVVDGMLALEKKHPGAGYRDAALAHLREYCRDDGRLVYTDAHCRPAIDAIHTIEETLMFAAIARLMPDHPSLAVARAFWDERLQRLGMITDPGMPSAEGCYTVAYPLAVYGRVNGLKQYEDLAISELRARQKRLVRGDDLFLRSYDDGRMTFPNWSRGVGWYFVGLVKTIAELSHRTDIDDLREEASHRAAWAVARCTSDGIWNCFLGDTSTPPDTAGSSGIAAALAFGAAHGILDAKYRGVAATAVETLKTYLTPDGLLTGVSQSNCGGEALQRGPYRVIFPMGMGLLAQAMAWV